MDVKFLTLVGLAEEGRNGTKILVWGLQLHASYNFFSF
jgi:hypothetical protein